MKKLILFTFLIACVSCQNFRQKISASESYYQMRWDQAVVLLREKNFEEAEVILKEVYASAQTADPELATRALFELGQISEKRGQWDQALSQFKECELKKRTLPGFKAELELPARLAGLYAILGELKTSESYAKKVESNLQAYMQQISMVEQRSWWAETFYRMGSLPVRSIDANNWQDFARRFHVTSQYLIRSMELADPLWSERSLELAQAFFKKSFEFLTVSPVDLEENSVLLGSVVRERINTLEEILQKIQLYRPPSLEKSRAARLFYLSVDDYELRVKNQLYEVKDSAPLSRESQRRNSIERDINLKDPSRSDIDKTKNDPKM